jgi:tetratricopeptide (TPR) repeat protein
MPAKTESIEALIEQEMWTEARRAIREELKAHPADHWLLTRLSTTYYEERDYEEALRWVEKAREMAPDCPLVLWDYAGTLDMLGREREAIAVYQTLLQRGVEAIAAEECGEGEEWARGLLTDCVYRAGRCFEDLEDRRKAADLYGTFLNLVDLGAPSIYSREDALARLRKLPGQRKSSIERTLERIGRELVDAGAAPLPGR